MDYLNQTEQAQLQALRLPDSFVDEALRQIDRILASRKFERVQQHAKDFLGFVVAMKLLGREDAIKETTIAINVFHEAVDYNSAESSKVRVAGRTLRKRLSEYCAGEGRADPIAIMIPHGAYVPQIRDRRASVAISVFENWNPGGDHGHLCSTVSDEIVQRLVQEGGIQAGPVSAFELGEPRLRYGLRGSLECRDDVLRLNASLSDLKERRIIASQSFEGRRDDLLKLSAKVAGTILRALSPHNCGIAALPRSNTG